MRNSAALSTPDNLPALGAGLPNRAAPAPLFAPVLKLRTIGHKLRLSQRAKVRIPEKRADSFYLSKDWRTFVDALIVERFGSRDRARCEDPQCARSSSFGVRLFADHVRELRDGGLPYDRQNILFRCGSCHTRKTAEERARRLKT